MQVLNELINLARSSVEADPSLMILGTYLIAMWMAFMCYFCGFVLIGFYIMSYANAFFSTFFNGTGTLTRFITLVTIQIIFFETMLLIYRLLTEWNAICVLPCEIFTVVMRIFMGISIGYFLWTQLHVNDTVEMKERLRAISSHLYENLLILGNNLHMMYAFYARADGIKILMVGLYALCLLISVANIWEAVITVGYFRFAIAVDLPPTDIPWYAGMDSTLQAQTYAFTAYWWFMIFVSLFKFAVYISVTVTCIAGFKRRWMYPIALGILIVEVFADAIRGTYALYQSFNPNVCFLCWSQVTPYGPDPLNVYYVWYVRLNIAVPILGFLIFLAILGLKQLVTRLVPDEKVNGAVQVAGEYEVHIHKDAARVEHVTMDALSKPSSSIRWSSSQPINRHSIPTSSAPTSEEIAEKMAAKGLVKRKHVVRINNIWTLDVEDVHSA